MMFDYASLKHFPKQPLYCSYHMLIIINNKFLCLILCLIEIIDKTVYLTLDDFERDFVSIHVSDI